MCRGRPRPRTLGCRLLHDKPPSEIPFWEVEDGTLPLLCRGRPRPRKNIPMLSAPATKYSYRRRLPHFQYDDKPLFITFATFGRMPLRPAARDLMLKHCLYDHGSKYLLHAAVVMPEHVHLLLSPLRDAAGEVFPLQQILQSLKSASAHSINKALCRQGPVWRERSFDHVLRSYESLEDKLEYIRQNPVRRRLVRRPEDYRWLWVAPRII